MSMERIGRPASLQYKRLGRSESLDRLLGSAAWANEIEPAAKEDQPQQQPQMQQGRGRLLRTRSLPDLLGLRRRASHWKALSWLLDPAGSRRKVGSLEYFKDNGTVASKDQSYGRSASAGDVAGLSKVVTLGGGDDKNGRKKQRQKNKKRSSWLPDRDKRWPIQGW